jgi:amidohydrolase
MVSKYEKYYFKIKELYRELHKVPELGFDLEKTTSIVKAELNSYGIEYTEKYGRGSVVAEIGNGEKVIALRADMDALPIEENSGVSFISTNKGVMHACGHDSHTAILLGVAKALKDVEDKLKIRVRLIFQPSEEGLISGAKTMVENGVMDGVSEIVATHCDPDIKWGEIGVCSGDCMASCISLSIKFLGKSAHATMPERGVDAVKMAVEAYNALNVAVKEEAQGRRYIWTVGKIEGGISNNIIADSCELKITFRFYDSEFAKKVESRTNSICNDIGVKYGGKVEIDWPYGAGAVINDTQIVSKLKAAIKDAGIIVNEIEPKMTSEDFSEFLQKAKGVLFRYGIYNEQERTGEALHTCNFKIYEPAMLTALTAFIEYVMQEN